MIPPDSHILLLAAGLLPADRREAEPSAPRKHEACENRAASPASEANKSTSQSIELTGERWAFKHAMAGQRRVAVERPPRISEKHSTYPHPSRPAWPLSKDSQITLRYRDTGRLGFRGALGTSELAEPAPSFDRNAPGQAFRSSLARPSRNATSAFSPASLAADSVLKSVP